MRAWPPRLVFATTNSGKLREVGEILAADGVEVVGVDEVAPGWQVVEDGATFAENARLKARDLARRTGLPVLGDDSGLEVDALGGRPGVRSARYAGEHASDEENLQKLLREAPAGSRLEYVCVIAYVDPAVGVERCFEGRCTGRLTDKPRGSGGFGYDPAIEADDGPPRSTMAELSDTEKDAISHRGRAARELATWLESP